MSRRRPAFNRLPHATIGLLLLVLAWSVGAGPAEAREPGGTRPHRAAMFRPMDESRPMRQAGADRAQQRAAMRGAAREGSPPPREAPGAPGMPSREGPAALQSIPQSAPQSMPQSMPQPPVPASPEQPATRPGRLTPEERRALRQQINEAGRDVYRPYGR